MIMSVYMKEYFLFSYSCLGINTLEQTLSTSMSKVGSFDSKWGDSIHKMQYSIVCDLGGFQIVAQITIIVLESKGIC